MRARLPLCIGAAISVALGGVHARSSTDTPRLTVGTVEVIRIEPENIRLEAKIDTGADFSSLHAQNVTIFSRDGRDWVRFEADGRRKPRVLERPIERMARIRRSGTETDERPVVMLDICLGALLIRTEVNLSDRTGMDYQVLLGRNLLAGRTIIDPARKHLTRPACRKE